MVNISTIQDLRSIRDRGRNTEPPVQENTTNNNTDNSVTNTENNSNIIDFPNPNPNPPSDSPNTNTDTTTDKTLKQIYEELVSANDKIAKFSELLKEKINIPVQSSPAQPAPESPELITPDAPQEDNSPSISDIRPPKGDNMPNKMKSLLLGSPLGKITTVVSSGFKSLTKVGDKISSTLFKMSISAAIETAKMAAMIFGLILGFDLIKIYLKYFIDWIVKKWDELVVSWGNYFKDFGKLGTIMDSIDTGIGEMINAFKTGDFPGIVKAIVNAGVRNYNAIGETIRLAIVHGLSSVVRALGFKDKADQMDAAAEQRYADNTNGNLTTEEQKNVAKRQSEDIKNDNDYQDRGLTSFLAPDTRAKLGIITETQANMANAEKKATPALKSMSDTDRESALIKINEVKKMMYNYKEHSVATNVGNASDVKRLSGEYDAIQSKLSDKVFDTVPQIKTAIQTELFQSKQAVEIRTPKTTPPNEQEDVKTVQKIQKNRDADIAGIVQGNTNTANVNNTKVVNNKSVQIQTPITGSRAPGVFGLGGIN